MKKQYSIIYVVYILLGLALGLWEAFKPIWLIEKGLSIENLGVSFFIALSMASIFSLLVGKKVMNIGIRKSIQIALFLRVVIFCSMILINNRNLMIF